MGSKNISVPDDVYEKLREERRADESFGEAIDRLLGRKRLSECWGAWDDETAADARAAIAASRERSSTFTNR
jgi:predicted CopG family antitoxin